MGTNMRTIKLPSVLPASEQWRVSFVNTLLALLPAVGGVYAFFVADQVGYITWALLAALTLGGTSILSPVSLAQVAVYFYRRALTPEVVAMSGVKGTVLVAVNPTSVLRAGVWANLLASLATAWVFWAYWPGA